MSDFNFEELPKRKKRESITVNYSFSCTPEMRECLRALNRTTEIDVNESFRMFSDFIIKKHLKNEHQAV